MRAGVVNAGLDAEDAKILAQDVARDTPELHARAGVERVPHGIGVYDGA